MTDLISRAEVFEIIDKAFSQPMRNGVTLYADICLMLNALPTHANSRSTHERDLISRTDAIEAVKKEIQDFEANYMHGEDDEEYGHDIGFVAGLHTAKTFIRSLPSAALPMNDLISREDAIRWVKIECNPYGKPTLDYDSGLKVIEHLKKMPSELPSAEAVHKPDYSYEADMVRRLKESQKGSYTGFCKSQLITCNRVKECNGVCPFEDALKHADKTQTMNEQQTVDHDREWIIGCIKHDGFIKTDRFDKANQIILDALSGEAVQRGW